ITFPLGTTFTTWQGGGVTVGGPNVGSCNAPSGPTPLTVRCFLFSSPGSIAASTAVTVTMNGVNNPTTAASYMVSVSTTSDTTPVTSTSYSVPPVKSISNVTATNTPTTTAASGLTSYVVGFTTSSTGALAPARRTSNLITFPSGTTFATWQGGGVT